MKGGAQRCSTTNLLLLLIWICLVADTAGAAFEQESLKHQSSLFKTSEERLTDNVAGGEEKLRRRRENGNDLDDGSNAALGENSYLATGDMKKYDVLETIKKLSSSPVQKCNSSVPQSRKRKKKQSYEYLNGRNENGLKGIVLKASEMEVLHRCPLDSFNSWPCQRETFENDEPNVEEGEMLKAPEYRVMKASITTLPVKVFSAIPENQGEPHRSRVKALDRTPVINLQVGRDMAQVHHQVVPIPCQKPTEFSLFTTTKKGCPEHPDMNLDCPSTCPTACPTTYSTTCHNYAMSHEEPPCTEDSCQTSCSPSYILRRGSPKCTTQCQCRSTQGCSSNKKPKTGPHSQGKLCDCTSTRPSHTTCKNHCQTTEPKSKCKTKKCSCRTTTSSSQTSQCSCQTTGNRCGVSTACSATTPKYATSPFSCATRRCFTTQSSCTSPRDTTNSCRSSARPTCTCTTSVYQTTRSCCKTKKSKKRCTSPKSPTESPSESTTSCTPCIDCIVRKKPCLALT